MESGPTMAVYASAKPAGTAATGILRKFAAVVPAPEPARAVAEKSRQTPQKKAPVTATL